MFNNNCSIELALGYGEPRVEVASEIAVGSKLRVDGEARVQDDDEHLDVSTCRVQNPDILRAGRVGAAHGEARRGRVHRDADGVIGPEVHRPSCFRAHRR